MKKSALLIIDIQNDYFPDGLFPLTKVEEAAANAASIQQLFREKKQPVIVVEHESVQEGATFFLPGSKGQEVVAQIAPVDTDIIIKKHYPNSFKETNLLEELKELGVEHLVVTGMMTFMCVDATIRAAIDLGFSCTLIHDATAARPLEFENKRVSAEDVQGAFVGALAFLCKEIVSTDDYLKRG